MDQSEPNVNVSIVDLSSLTPDRRNANRGTERGRYMVARSHEKFGAARSGVIDRNGVIIAGNKSAEAQAELGMDRVIVVETDGSMPVYVRRRDLDIDDPKARELAYADNRTSEVDLQWDAEQIARDQLDGIDVSDFFRQDEIDRLMDAMTGHTETRREQEADDRFAGASYCVIVDCDDEGDQLSLIDRFIREGLTCRALIT